MKKKIYWTLPVTILVASLACKKLASVRNPGKGKVLPLAAATVEGTTLSANGTTDTYTLINSVLGGTAEEVPDCSHPSFGPHITQVYDSALGKYVFAFWIHVHPDNDRCVNFDRQRNEIKTYSASPDKLIGFLNDTLTHHWKFKLPSGFQPSPKFTHIHQIKAGDGDDGAALITLTPRYGSPDKMQLIHTGSTTATSLGTVASVNLAPFMGVWVEAEEHIIYKSKGTYSITIKRMRDDSVLLSYSNTNIDMWRDSTTFCRPKWGIYRSLDDSTYLRDEKVLFDDFCIAKGTAICP